MNVADKFSLESKQKMKEMIKLSLKEDIEYYTIIKKDFTLGEIKKGEEDYCEPKKFIESNKENTIGFFHTHPHHQDFFNYSQDIEKHIEPILRIMNLNEEAKKDLRKRTKEHMVKASASMSPDDLRFSLAYNLIIECIGTTDKKDKPIVFCYELYSDAKKRFKEKLKTLDKKESKLFLLVYKNWLNNNELENNIDGFIEAYVLMRTRKWVIKETSEINLDFI